MAKLQNFYDLQDDTKSVTSGIDFIVTQTLPCAAFPVPHETVPLQFNPFHVLEAAAPLIHSAVGTGTSSTASTAATIGIAPSPNVTGGAAPSWVSSILDSALKADMVAMVGNVTEAGLGKMMTDLAGELTANKATLSASQFSDLKIIVADINVGEAASVYEVYTLNALVNGNAANAMWTGGGSSTKLGNLAVGSTVTQISELDGKWLLGTDLASSNVNVGGHAFTVAYSPSAAPLFGSNGPMASDINQGQLGDCYFLSTLAEVAAQDPSIIKNMITNNGNGTYGVCFHVNGQAEYVTVNSALQSNCNSGSDMWGTLLEKAYAELQSINVTTGNSYSGNSFTAVGNGGMPECALESVTGASQINDFYARGSTWTGATYNSSLVLTGTNKTGLATSTVLSILKADLAAGDDLILSSNTWSYDAAGHVQLVANHAMSIYGIDAANGNLEIRNPWGTHSGQYWDTAFEVSLVTLLAAGDVITADNTGGSAPAPVTPAAPTLNAQTPTMTINAGKAFSFALPSDTFVDPQSLSVTYKALLSNGQALPSWLSFNAQTEVFSGTAPTAATTLGVKVTATDSAGLSSSETFSINDVMTALKAPTVNYLPLSAGMNANGTLNITVPQGTFVDPQGQALTYSALQANGQVLPNWIIFNARTDSFAASFGTQAESVNVTVKATNNSGLSATETFGFSLGGTGGQMHAMAGEAPTDISLVGVNMAADLVAHYIF